MLYSYINQEFCDNPTLNPDADLQLQLEDFACDDDVESIKGSDVPISVSSTLLCQYLNLAREQASIENAGQGAGRLQIKKRLRGGQ